MDNSFVTMSDLEYRIANLKRRLAAFESGEKYLSMKAEYSDMLAYEERIISRVTRERDAAYAQVRDVREKWYETCKLAAEENARIIRKKDSRIKKLEDSIQVLKSKNAADKERTKAYYENLLEERDAVIDELKNKLMHYEALLDIDGTNSGIPTSHTPIGKKKVIPNTREKSGRLKGGQPGHEKHMLMPPADDEVKDLISDTVHERNEMIRQGEKRFSDAYIQAFNDKMDDIMERAEKKNEEDYNAYSGPFEKRIINRMKKYKDYYFEWLKDFSLPTTNNFRNGHSDV